MLRTRERVDRSRTKVGSSIVEPQEEEAEEEEGEEEENGLSQEKVLVA